MEDSTLNCLPQEIMLNIISRLPTELVLDSKLVCRSWKNLVQFHENTNYFAYQHLQRQHGYGLSPQQQQQPVELFHGEVSDSAPMCFVFLDRTPQGTKELYYAEYQDIDETSDPTFVTKRIKINFNFLKAVSGIIGSCNGLVCLSIYTEYLTHGCCGYICNPITGEIMNLPGLSFHKQKHNERFRMALGFGYHTLTNEYKVVRICYTSEQDDKPSKGQVAVYTLGNDNGWRGIGETSYNVCSKYISSIPTSGVWFNGAIHWLHEGSSGIVAFNLEREDFELLPVPTSVFSSRGTRLFAMRGSLCCISEYFVNDQRELSVWVSRKKNEEIISSIYHEKVFNKRWACVFAITRGRILQLREGVVSLYDLKTSTSELIWQSKYKVYYTLVCAVPISHINSFVSLKALGERSTMFL